MKSSKQIAGMTLVMLTLLLSLSVHAAKLRDFDGNLHTLSEYTGKGKWIVVMLWHSNCRMSNAVVHEYVDFHMRHSDDNATVLGVSLDGFEKKADAKGFIDKHDIEFFNLIGDYDEITDMTEDLSGIPWRGTPMFLVYSPTGDLRVAESGKVPAKLIEGYIKKNSN